MAMILRIPLILVVLCALLASACSTTQTPSISSSAVPPKLPVLSGPLKFSWKDAAYRAHPHRILVMGLTHDSLHRRIFEDEFVSQLRALGADAVASYTVLPDEQMDDQAAVTTMSIEQVPDSILLTRFVGKRNLKVYAQAASYRPANYGRWRDYYRHGYETSATRTNLAKSSNALMESHLYDRRTENLIWAAAYDAENISADSGLIKSYVTLMVKNMLDQGFFR